MSSCHSKKVTIVFSVYDADVKAAIGYLLDSKEKITKTAVWKEIKNRLERGGAHWSGDSYFQRKIEDRENEIQLHMEKLFPEFL